MCGPSCINARHGFPYKTIFIKRTILTQSIDLKVTRFEEKKVFIYSCKRDRMNKNFYHVLTAKEIM